MLYAAMVFWLLVLVFAAYGTHQLWAGMMKPNVLNVVLLPGTVTQVDNGSKCFGYMATFSATVPGNVRKGARAALQALAEVSDAKNVIRPAFSTPIDIIVL